MLSPIVGDGADAKFFVDKIESTDCGPKSRIQLSLHILFSTSTLLRCLGRLSND